uniref:NADH-ubiquinone oxidoreductase chain 2 n=1 Tax=Patiria pectinifera TaxID=7594 RepID=NU2M_PATPE|nr:NADH dehydrogenase subunit 2 [Patiria pectinifera]Q33819.1 RecName: Full=NADH-ubiquinone oxidoreductase chain 2; AltName: Full=NADH dehydrogenase subunit 2 [Patiria pectinifera]BAA03878.1 NADH-dehydrogenase subunit 2 [Patiria pectinifera]
MHRNILMVLIANVVLGTLIVLSSHHWFTLWVGLEMNTLSILPILSYQFTPRNVESSVKYFLVQSVSAGIVLNVVIIQAWLYSSWSLMEPLNQATSFLMTLALGLKLGLFPCHYWFPDVIQGVGFIQGLVLSTWQKIAPFAVLVYVVESLNISLLASLGVLSVLVGGWGGLNQTQMRKIFAFSSIAHIGWICSTVGYSVSVACVMLVAYIIINSSVFFMANSFDLKSLSHVGRLSLYNFVGGAGLVLSILSLGGLPPLFGFLIKFISLKCLVENGCFILAGVLVMGSLLSLFFYLRIAFNSSLTLFPQHSLVVFSWRSNRNQTGGFTSEGVLLSVSFGISSLGLVCLPVFISLLN